MLVIIPNVSPILYVDNKYFENSIRFSYDGTNSGGTSSPISAILFNGIGWNIQNDVLTRPERLPLESFALKRGENVVIRVVNAGSAHPLMLSIDDHLLQIIAAGRL